MEDAATLAAPVRDGWLIWEAPGKPVSVRLSPDLVNRLGLAVREGFKSIPRRGLETGGLLIGTTNQEGAHIILEIDDFEPIESEHAAGPSYLLSEADLRLLEERIAARRRSPAKSSIVGFYRSHTRPDFAITPEDASLFSTYFPKASDVFLLIKSNDCAAPTGGFIIREGGEVLSPSPYTEFPLNLTLARVSAREIPPTVQRPARISPVRTLQILPPPTPPRATWIARWPIWLAIAGALVLAVSLPFGRHPVALSIPPARPVQPVQPLHSVRPLALAVTNSGNGLTLSWDHQASNLADRAILWIKDGPEQQKFELDAKQLSEGSIAYWPKNGDVNFRLELFTAGASVTESVRAIGGPSRPPVIEAVPAPASPRPTSPAKAYRNRTGTASRTFSRAFALPKSAPVAAAPAPLPDPPSIHPVAAPPPEPTLPGHSPGIRQRAESAVEVSVEPVPGTRLERLARNIPLLGKHYRRADYVPPAPRRHPPFPNLQHRAVTHEVPIDIKVFVNPAGKVDYSEVLSKVPPSDSDLKAMALLSARECEFIPAHAADGALPGVVILHYRFVPE